MLFRSTTINTGQAQGRIYASLYVRLVDRADRQRNVDQLTQPMRERLASIPGITVTHVGLLDTIGGTKPISVSIQGPDLMELDRLTRQLTAKIRNVPGVADLDTSLKANKPTINVQVRRDAVADAGLSVGAVTTTLRGLVAGDTVGQWQSGSDQKIGRAHV